MQLLSTKEIEEFWSDIWSNVAHHNLDRQRKTDGSRYSGNEHRRHT